MAAKKSAFWRENRQRLVDLVLQNRHPVDGRISWAPVARALNKTRAACLQQWGEILAGPNAPPLPDLQPPPPQPRTTSLDLPPRPFEVPIVAPALKRRGERYVAVLFGDTHVPYHDMRALNAVYGIIRDARPDLVVHMGDLLDCYRLSRFSKDPNRAHALQDEIDGARTVLHQVAQIAPQARRVFLEGNHEDRLRRTIWAMPGEQSELARLTAFREAITWPVLLGLDEVGWEFRSYQGQSRAEPLLPHLILKHGTVVRKWSGWTAKGEWERHGKGGASGHTHRLGAFFHRDHNGSHVWVETGCTCTLLPDYMTDDPDWQQGCVVVSYSGDRFGIEMVYYQDGEAVWRGEQYAGKEGV